MLSTYNPIGNDINTINPEYKIPKCPIRNRTIYMNKIDMMKYYQYLKKAPDFEGRNELLNIFENDLKNILLEIALEQEHLQK